MSAVLPTEMSDWLVPDWPAPHGVLAICTTRRGGVSQGPYQSLNLGAHVGDAPAHVQFNRLRLQELLGSPGGGRTIRPVFLNQVHGAQVLNLDAATPDGALADGAVTDGLRLACTVMVADCLPVLLCNALGTRVAAAHAGWRGLAGGGGCGVLEATADALVEPGGGPSPERHAQTLAWLGPCIGPTAFEVGNDVRDACIAAFASAKACFSPCAEGKWLADLPALARLRLNALGIERIYGNDGSTPWCTVSNPSRFFSHRRDRVSGRMAACIWRVD